MVTQTEAEKAAQRVFDEGYRASKNTLNPYPKNTQEYRLWKQGAEFRDREYHYQEQIDNWLWEKHKVS